MLTSSFPSPGSGSWDGAAIAYLLDTNASASGRGLWWGLLHFITSWPVQWVGLSTMLHPLLITDMIPEGYNNGLSPGSGGDDYQKTDCLL